MKLSGHLTAEGRGIFPVLEFPSMDELPVIACSLPAAELDERRARWKALADRAFLERALLPTGVRLSFLAEEGVEEELRALADLERECCAFASFRVVAGAKSVSLDVTAEGDGVTAVREIFV